MSKIYFVFVFLLLTAVNLNAFNGFVTKENSRESNEIAWRQLSSLRDYGWGDGWDGSCAIINQTHYYDGISPARPDSTFNDAYYNSSAGSPYDIFSMHVHSYTDYLTYYQVETSVHNLAHPDWDYRIIKWFDYDERPLLYYGYHVYETGNSDTERYEYIYDTNGNLIEKLEWYWSPNPYNLKWVTRYTYRPDNQVLSMHKYSVINGDLDSLNIVQRDVMAYNSIGQMVAKNTLNYSTYSKYLYSYNNDGLVATMKEYVSNDSLSWRLLTTKETTYGISFAELKPIRVDTYSHSYSDSTNTSLQNYGLYSYLDENRDTFITTYGDYIDSQTEHIVYNSAMKLVLHNYNWEYQGSNEWDNNSYVWDSFVSASDPAIPQSGLKLGVFPNPIRSNSVITYFLPDYGAVKIELFNIRGQKVAILYSGSKQPGKHQLDLQVASLHLASGLYYLRLHSGKDSIVEKVMVIR